MAVERIRGRKAVALRRARLTAEPLCRDCKELHGRVRVATVPDHILPLAKGGTDDGQVVSPQIRCLCAECHRLRTAEQFGHEAGPEKYRIGLDGFPIGRNR